LDKSLSAQLWYSSPDTPGALCWELEDPQEDPQDPQEAHQDFKISRLQDQEIVDQLHF
jgi:hypothetical protein